MESLIEDPETVEERLAGAGFEVNVREDGFEVTLINRIVRRAEIADLLGCETEQLGKTNRGVLVR